MSQFPVDEAADCCIVLPAPGFWLQTGPCMPYGLWLRVATHIYIYPGKTCRLCSSNDKDVSGGLLSFHRNFL